MTNNKPETVNEMINDIFNGEENSDKLDSIKGPWLLDEFKRKRFNS